MPFSRITSVHDLRDYLHAAMQLEHATIPPYLTALYSIHPETNSDAFHVIRVVVVEEMLHLTLAANLLNAVGGKPNLTAPGFVPDYPAYLPDGETDFEVSRQRFCKECVETFLKIERPRKAPDEESRLLHRDRPAAALLAAAPNDSGMQFYSIGEFYREIECGIRQLHKEGVDLFTGKLKRQVTPEYYYSGGGEVIPVIGLDSACSAIRLIAEQGEGLGGRIYDVERELAHYYRFQQLKLERYYMEGDEPDHPSGPPLRVDWDAVFPIKKNVRVDDYPDGSELQAAALDFNAVYGEFLGLVTRAYTGEPELLLEAVAEMLRLRDRMTQLIHNPIPGSDGVNAAPTFELAAVAGTVAS